MKRLICMVLLCALLCACAPNRDEVTGRYFTDDLGRTVVVDQPQRVACLLGSFADVWYHAGGTIIAAPDDAWVDFGFPMPEDAVNLGNTKDLSLEALLAAEPDFVIGSVNTPEHLQWKDTLEAAGIPVAYFDVSDFEDYLHMLQICTEITGRPELYEQNGTAIASRIEDSVSRTRTCFGDEPPKVLYLRASAASIRAKGSQGNVLGEMLADFGCVNIADSDDSLLENLSMEHILLQDPDYIFFVQLGDDAAGTQANIDDFLGENPAWQTLTAVKEGRVITLDKRLYNLTPNARWADAYEQLEEILCEERS